MQIADGQLSAQLARCVHSEPGEHADLLVVSEGRPCVEDELDEVLEGELGGVCDVLLGSGALGAHDRAKELSEIHQVLPLVRRGAAVTELVRRAEHHIEVVSRDAGSPDPVSPTAMAMAMAVSAERNMAPECP